MNDRSSRSHTVFRIVIESRECVTGSSRDSVDGAVRVAHLNLVDLAGSERVANTGAEGQRLKEGAHINKSLLTLGTVIGKLSDGYVDNTPSKSRDICSQCSKPPFSFLPIHFSPLLLYTPGSHRKRVTSHTATPS
jgi:centromeric protein E